jgi:hypothetical protein
MMQAVKYWFALVLLVVLAVGVVAGFVDWAAGVIGG